MKTAAKNWARSRIALRRYFRGVEPARPAHGDDVVVVGTAPRRQARRLRAALLDDPTAAFACGPVFRPPTSRSAPFVVATAGWELTADPAPATAPIGAGESVDPAWVGAVTRAALPSGPAMAVRRGDLEGAVEQGWSPDLGLPALGQRLGSGLVVWAAPSMGVAEPPSLTGAEDAAERRRNEGLGADALLPPGPPTAPPPGARWIGGPHRRRQPACDGPGGPLRVAIRHAATDWSVADRWGDHHFASAMARALERRGIGTRIVPAHAWRHPVAARDLVITVRGLQPVAPVPGRLNVLWLISHPDEIDPHELDAHDLVAVASTLDVERIARLTDTPVVPLLQATDARRFQRPLAADPRGTVFVGNSRGVRRPAVDRAADAGVPLQVHGVGWEGLAPATVDLRPPVPNAEIADVFNAAAVVLTDHWADMAARGYVANRLFDVYAAGSLPISDPVAGLDDVLPGTPTWDDDLGEVVAQWADPANRPARTELVGRLQAEVLNRHTFDHRVDELLAAIGTIAGGADLVASLTDA